MKIIRVLRLNRLINFMSTSSDIKLSLRLLQSIFLILLYIHISGCIWYFNIKDEKIWEPSQGLSYDFHSIDNFGEKFFIIFYTSILAVLGNDLSPTNLFEYFVACCMLLFGALLQASIFG